MASLDARGEGKLQRVHLAPGGTATISDLASVGENAFGFAKNAHDVWKSIPCREFEHLLWSYLIVQSRVAIVSSQIDEGEMSVSFFCRQNCELGRAKIVAPTASAK